MTANERLDALLNQAEEGDAMRADEAQAFLMALGMGPDSLDIEFRLPEIIDERAYTDSEKAEIVRLLHEMAQKDQQDLQAGRAPELILYPDETQAPDYLTWCNAFLYALDVTETDWFEAANDEEFEDLFYPLMVLAGDYEEESLALDVSDAQRQSLASELPQTLLVMARYWQAKRNAPRTVRRTGQKLGRNDPCPCGSGKKFKACCGAAA